MKDPEIRSRASALITKIEGGLLTKPTMVALDFHDQPLAEVVRVFGDQSGIKMAIFPEQPPGPQQKRVTLQESAPLPSGKRWTGSARWVSCSTTSACTACRIPASRSFRSSRGGAAPPVQCRITARSE